MESVYREHAGFVRSCLRRFHVREERLDDAVHDVFVTMLGRAGESYDRARHVRPWLLGISRNIARNQRRRAARRAGLADQIPVPTETLPSPDDAVAHREASSLLQAFLAGLDEAKLAPFIAVEIEGRSAGEVALELGLPVTTVRWRVRAARAELEALAARRSPDRLPALVVWLWPFHSARLAPRIAWFAVMLGLLLAVWSGLRPGAAAGPATVANEGTPLRSSGDVPPAATPSRPATEVAAGLQLQSGAIAGRVLDVAGRGIAGARVCHCIDVMARVRIDDVEATCTKADGQGRYRLASVRAGPQRVVASAEGFIPATYGGPQGTGRLPVEAGTEHGDVDLVLHGGGVRVAGVVRDRTGGVVGGAVVRAGDFTRFSEGRAAFGVTDDEGRFALWVAPGRLSVEATAVGYSAGRRSALAPQSGVEVELMPEVTLSGRVVDGEGTPQAGVVVRANRDEHNAPEGFLASTTDARGRFTLRRLRPGSYRPIASGAGGYGEAGDAVLLAFGERAPEVTLVTEPAARLTVDVEVDEALGRCDGESVMAGGEDVRYDVRIEGGGAMFPTVKPGRYELFARCRGAEARALLTIEPGQTEARASLRFSAERTVRGVLERRGDLGPFSSLLAAPADAKLEGPMLPKGFALTRTDADGRFAIALGAAGDWALYVSALGGSKLPLATFSVADGEDVDLGAVALPRLGSVEGRVRDTDGTPRAGLSVEIVRGTGLSVATRPDGTFSLLHMMPGAYELRVRRGSMNLAEAVAVDVEADAAATVTVEVPRLDGALAGQVLGPGGEPVADATVKVHSTDDSVPEAFRGVARTAGDYEGRFSVDGLLPATYRVLVVGESRPGEDGEPCEGSAEVEVRGGGRPAVAAVQCR